MNNDELRRRIFELDSLLGKAMGTADTIMDQNKTLMDTNRKLADTLTCLCLGVQKYVHSMRKEDLIKAVDEAGKAAEALKIVPLRTINIQ